MKTEFDAEKEPRNVSFLTIIDFCFTRLQRTIAVARCFDSDRSTCCSCPLLKIANLLSEEASTIDGDREKKEIRKLEEIDGKSETIVLEIDLYTGSDRTTYEHNAQTSTK